MKIMDNVLDILTGMADEITSLIDDNWKYLSDDDKDKIYNLYTELVKIQENCTRKAISMLLTKDEN